MSRKNKLKARDRITQKNTRDGLVERNVTTGEDIRISKREADFDLRGDTPVQETNTGDSRFSQVGKRSQHPGSQTRTPQKQQNAQRRFQQSKPDAATEQKSSVGQESAHQTPLQFKEGQQAAEYPAQTDTNITHTPDTTLENTSAPDTPQTSPLSDNRHGSPSPQGTKGKQSVPKSRYYRQGDNRQPVQTDSPYTPKPEPAPDTSARTSNPSQPQTDRTELPTEPPQKPATGKPDSRLNTYSHGRLKFSQDEAAPAPKGKRHKPKPRFNGEGKPSPEAAKPATAARPADTARPDSSVPPKPADKPADKTLRPKSKRPTPTTDKPDALKADKPGKLQFTQDEATPETPKIHHNRKLNKAQAQAERVTGKLEKARDSLPSKRKLRKVNVTDAKTGEVKRKLQFENTPISRAEHIKGPLPLRPVKAAGNSALAFGHRKMFQVERENVGTEAAHKGEMLAEGGVRSVLRFRKTAPYRKVEKLERKAAKKSINLTYQQMLDKNPKMKSNLITRALQKRKIKKDYAKAAREAQKAAKKAKKAGSVVTDVGKALIGVVKRHPVATVVIILIALLLFAVMSLIGAGGSIGSGGLGGILSASYLAEDVDIDNAELAYTEWEVGLREQISNTESTHPGYDEYRYNISEISHNPYELMAYLTVKYQNFTYDAIEADLRAIFGEQYTITYTPSVETRYRTVTKTDPDTGESYDEQEAYDWRVLTVTLTARSFGDVATTHLSGDEYAHYALLLQTKGARQYIGNPFDFDWLPYVTSYYGYRIHPITGVKDLHRGIDIGVAAGTEIRSGQDGTVTFAGWSGDYGNVVVIDDGKGLVSKYAHCQTLLVTEGQPVKMGDVIATVGSTGSSTGPHLHLEVMKNGIYVNPIYFADTGSFMSIPNYGNPGAPMGDGTYAALIAEAEKYLGYPYVIC